MLVSHRLVGPNDLVFDRQGGFWFTDNGCETQEGRKWGGLYYARPDGSKITRARGRLITPNGVGLSPDERVVYMADTLLGRLWAFDVESPGVLMPPVGAIPGRVICNLPGVQYLDSMAVEDCKTRLPELLLAPGRILSRHEPDPGRKIASGLKNPRIQRQRDWHPAHRERSRGPCRQRAQHHLNDHGTKPPLSGDD
jgi:sugar lactone lactonase YvrE